MYDYYCNNCKNIVGQWNNEHEWYNIDLNFCNYIKSKKIKSIYFVDCKNCDKYVGLLCLHVCENCFGKKQILNEETLFNFFLKSKKISKKNLTFDYCCKNCNKYNFRWQHWFFEELILVNFL